MMLVSEETSLFLPRVDSSYLRRWPDACYDTPTFMEEVAPGIFRSTYKIQGYDQCDRIDQYAVIDPALICEHSLESCLDVAVASYRTSLLFVDVGFWEVCGTEMLDAMVALASGVGALQRTATSRNLWRQSCAFITHFHDDHAGNIEYCIEKGTQHIFHGPRILFTHEVLERFAQVSGWNTHTQTSYQANRIAEALWDNDVLPDYCGTIVCEGEHISVGPYCFTVFAGPGHSPDHHYLVDQKAGIMFGGDHIAAGGPAIMQFEPDQGLVNHYLDTLTTLSNMNLQTIYSSHGDPIVGKQAVADILETTRFHIEKSLEKRRDIVTNPECRYAYPEGLTAYDVAEKTARGFAQLSEKPFRHRVRAVASAFSMLEALYERGEVTRTFMPDATLRYAAK